MTGLEFANTKFGTRVIGNKISTGYTFPEGWSANTPADPTWKMGGSEERTDWTMLVMQPDVSLDLKPSQCSNHTYIQLFKKTEELMEYVQKLSVQEIQELMGLSEKTAKSHSERFASFHKLPPKQACLIFGGEKLRASDWSESDVKYAEAHMRFLSGLYGLLRPYDDVKPVRDIPMGAKLATKRGAKLVDFWGDAITKQLSKDISSAGVGKKPLVVFLTSDEYLGALQLDDLPQEARILRISFEGASENEARKARGSFGRWIIRRRLTNTDELREFEHEDWALEKFKSGSSRLVFTWAGDSAQSSSKKDKKQKKDNEKEEKTEKAGKKEKDKDAKKGRESGSQSRSRSRSKGAKKARKRTASSGSSGAEKKGKARRRPASSASSGEVKGSKKAKGRGGEARNKSRSRGRKGADTKRKASPKRSRRARSSSS